MFTMRDYQVEAQRRTDEMAEARYQSLVHSASAGRDSWLGRLLILVGQRLVGDEREPGRSVIESSAAGAGRPGVSMA